MADDNKNADEPITIKKYANRRLYNTATSSYVTLDHLSQMVKDGTDFVVYDAKSGDDITRQILTHIIVEEEGKGQNLLPISFLRHLISFYGDSLQAIVPNYLDQSMHSFARNQEQMRAYMQDTLGEMNPFGRFEEMGKQNVAMMESAMKMFTPFYPDGSAGGDAGGGSAPQSDGSAPQSDGTEPQSDGSEPQSDGSGEQLDDLKSKLEDMQRQLDGLSRDKS
jgi:polyhydroxyalkanoate synthesis repressor PhaR